jgi:hypothetical protein
MSTDSPYAQILFCQNALTFSKFNFLKYKLKHNRFYAVFILQVWIYSYVVEKPQVTV